jgi:hypothetical protein
VSHMSAPSCVSTTSSVTLGHYIRHVGHARSDYRCRFPHARTHSAI